MDKECAPNLVSLVKTSLLLHKTKGLNLVFVVSLTTINK